MKQPGPNYKLGILIVHGMGSQHEGFANKLIEALKSKIFNESRVRWKPVLWAGLLIEREENLFTKLSQAYDLDWATARKFVIDYIGDALAYRFIPNEPNSIYYKVQELVNNSISELREELGDDDKPIIAIAHSLGSVIMFDYIWDRQHWDKKIKNRQDPHKDTASEILRTFVGLITYGSPIPLYSLAHDKVESIEFPDPLLLDKFRDKAKWLNYFHANDPLGWPLGPIYGRIVQDNDIWDGFTLFSHIDYASDNTFTDRVAEYINTFLS